MPNISCTRKLQVDVAHRVMGHKGNCQYLHGHRYAIEITCLASQLNEMGMVLDFSIIKDRLQEWLIKNWDHNVVLCIEDKELGQYISEATGQKVFFMQSNPTAENMALFLYYEVCPALFADCNIIIERIRVYETPNCYADVTATVNAHG